MVDMTPDALSKICKELKLYRTPELNDKLYLHYKGFRRIENLEAYTGLRAVWLEGNGLAQIEGLEKCTQLRTLYLHENCIREIENLDANVNLATLNLNKNCIEKVSNLAPLAQLETLMLSHNRLETVEDIVGLVECPTISTLDVQSNMLEDPRILDEVLVKLPNLRALYLQGNPVVKKIRHYRKRLTFLLPELRYLDDRPVFPDDRLRAVAFMTALEASDGDVKAAQQAERTEIKRQRDEKKAKEEANFLAFEEMIRNARLKGEAERVAKEAEEKQEGAGGGEEGDETAAPGAQRPADGCTGSAWPSVAPAASSDANPWAIPPKTDSQKAIAESQAAGVNPFSGEKVKNIPENATAKPRARKIWRESWAPQPPLPRLRLRRRLLPL